MMSTNTENLETFYLISFRNLIDSELYEQLQTIINYVVLFDDEEQCLQYIQSLTKDDRIFVIIKDNSSSQFVSQLVTLRQIVFIYIYTKKSSEQLTKNSKKIRDVFSQRDQLFQRIQADYTERSLQKLDEPFVYSIFTANTNQSVSMNTNFIHFQILIDCLICIKSSPNDKKDLISRCKQQYRQKSNEATILEEFEKDYRPERCLQWYTRCRFLDRILKKALQVQNIEILLLFRFLIQDLVEQFKSNKSLPSQRVYRAQLLSKTELDLLQKRTGEFLSMNIFLLANTSREQTRSFLLSLPTYDQTEKVLLEIHSNPRMHDVSHALCSSKEEVLFLIGSIFRMTYIERDHDGIWNIHLMLCSRKQHQLQTVIEQKRNELDIEETDLLSIGFLLQDMEKFDQAEKYYLHLLDQLSKDQEDLSRCYHALGEVMQKKGEYDSCLTWYNKALEAYKSDESGTAMSYNSMAIVYSKKRDYKLALKFFNKALNIWSSVLGEDHPDVAMCWNNIGIINQEEAKYTDALECYHKAWNIRQKCLSSDHPSLGQLHACIGNVNYQLRRYDLALDHYNSSIEIWKKTLGSHYLDMGVIYRNIGLVYRDKGDFQQALVHMKKAESIYRQVCSPTHHQVLQIEKLVNDISSKT
ncbi:unnamed protein product [Adineta ricciae]|uniref:Uncharacterized protein n=1 Tax=Adineta ricciae TaxID=249248 RepID=A0A814AH00_ADIRI|nr:unnamed protein product [Adineta ricciae]CAF1622881.1 unnamed protein product [Adineta ricciae]